MSANWGNVQQGLESGYKIGRSAGGKLSGLGMALSKIVESMRETRVANEVQGRQQNLLGYASGLRMAEAQTKEALKPKTQDIVSDIGEIVGKRPVGSVFQPKKQTPGLTLSNALSMLSDPFKARQLKRTYPKLYAEAENTVKANLGEEVLAKVIPPLKNPGKNKSKLSTDENIMDTNW